jgi:hypothetical protein
VPGPALFVPGRNGFGPGPCRVARLDIYRPDMPWVDSPFEAPSHLREPVGFLPSLAKIIVSADVFIYLLKQLLQSLWRLSSKILGSRSWTKPLFFLVTSMSLSFCHEVMVPGRSEEYHV